MNWKALCLLFALLFASAVTTVAVSLSTPLLVRFGATEDMILDTGIEPNGDPIDGPHPPT